MGDEGAGYSLGRATVIRDTSNAAFFLLDKGGRLWVPKACIHDDSDIWKDGQKPDNLIVMEWWAEKKGLVK